VSISLLPSCEVLAVSIIVSSLGPRTDEAFLLGKDDRMESSIEEEFVEIHPDDDDAYSCLPESVEAYVAEVEPRSCGPLVKRVSAELKLSTEGEDGARECFVDLSHLKRVKRTITALTAVTGSSLSTAPRDNNEANVAVPSTPDQEATKADSSPQKKRQKTTEDKVCLQVLLGAVSVLDRKVASTEKNGENENVSDVIKRKYALEHDIQKISVPGRPPQSELEWKAFQTQWPTTFFFNKSKEFRQAERKLSEQEIAQMRLGMEAAIEDAQLTLKTTNASQRQTCSNSVGTVIMDPQSGKIVARAAQEIVLQQELINHGGRSNFNPLATSLLYAIQNASRHERKVAVQQGMDSADFQGGQYLCTGYDVYTTYEPTVFEAMAAVHSRIRRMVVGGRFATTKLQKGYTTEANISSSSGLVEMKVHSLPGTNHKYRAFLCQPSGDLAMRCLELTNDKNV
jgi:tRNA(Arg) A34 adenosine deaminase TadA